MRLVRVGEQPLWRTLAGLHLVEKVAVVDHMLASFLIIEDLVHKGAVFTRHAAANAREFFNAELHIFKLERLDLGIWRNRVDALLAARAEQIQAVRHAESGNDPA